MNKEYHRQYSKNRYQKLKNDKDYKRERHEQYRKWLTRIKTEALTKIGGVYCTRCNCKRLDLLEVNHKIPIYNSKRKLHGRTIYLAIIRNEVNTSDFNVLCKACNIIHYIEHKYGIKYNIKLIKEQANLMSNLFKVNEIDVI